MPELVQYNILTATEVAHDLRCSRAHIYNMISGKVTGVSPVPAIMMGRRKLVRREALERWKLENENNGLRGDTIPSSAVNTVAGESGSAQPRGQTKIGLPAT
jgi:excisionase family DNA binding protein